MTATVTPAIPPPYIGLRYYEESDAALFYGRDEHITKLLGKLSRNRFVAVLGSSGSGKSSLVRAGLLPELRSGMIPHAGPQWLVTEFKPGNAPLQELGKALASTLKLPDAGTILEAGPLGIANAVAAAKLPAGTNVLVIADQFEEIFRYQREERDQGRETEAIQQCHALVRRLLDAAVQTEAPVYVLLVMRSDYLGECAQFLDLPERMSKSLYMVPRLRRDQVQEVVSAPVGNNIEPALVQELVGKAGTDPDQLPRLQHLLLRMWDLARGGRLTLDHYAKAGGWDGALGQHLDDVYRALGKSREVACARVFQQLSDIDESNRVVRRRASLQVLIQACGPEAEPVVAAFRKEGFLKPEEPVDPTHECILRNWTTFKHWLQEEMEARNFYREINVRRGRGTPLTGRDIVTADTYFRSGYYNPAWAGRYGTFGEFEEVRHFVTASATAEQKTKAREKNLRSVLRVLAASVLLISIVAIFWLWRTNSRVESQAKQIASQKQDLAKLNGDYLAIIHQNDQDRRHGGQAVAAKSHLAKVMPPAPTQDAVTIQYFAKQPELAANPGLVPAWQQLGFHVQVLPPNYELPCNIMWVGSEVDLHSAQQAAYALLANGLALRKIDRLPETDKKRARIIQVGWSSKVTNLPLTTTTDVDKLEQVPAAAPAADAPK